MTDYATVNTAPPSQSSSRTSSLTQKVTRPKTMLKLVGLASLMIIGLGVMAAIVQQSHESTDTRSQASTQTAKTIYFGDTSLFDVSAPVTVPIRIDAARNMSAVSFALDYDSDEVASVSFSPINAINFNTQTASSSANSAGGKRIFFMVTPIVPSGTSFLSSNLGNLTITFTPEFVARTYVTTNVSFVPNNVVSNLPNQAVPVDSSTEIFVLNPGAPLAMRTGGGGPTPTVNPSITPPAIPGLGQLWYCPDTNCADGGTTVPLWVSVPLASGQTSVVVPNTAQLLRYNVSGVAPSSPWTTVMKALFSGQTTEITGNAAPLVVGDTTNPMTASSWPVTLWANFRQNVGTDQVNVYNCTTLPDITPNRKKFLYYQLGNPGTSYSIPNGCRNDTRIVVQKQGTVAPTLTPTPTPTPMPTVPPVATCPAPSNFLVANLSGGTCEADGRMRLRYQWHYVNGATKYDVAVSRFSDFRDGGTYVWRGVSAPNINGYVSVTQYITAPNIPRWHRVRVSEATSCTPSTTAWSASLSTNYQCVSP